MLGTTYSDMNLNIMICPICKSKDVSLDISTNKIMCNNPRCRYVGKEKEVKNAQEFKEEQLEKIHEEYDKQIQLGESLTFPDAGVQSKPITKLF